MLEELQDHLREVCGTIVSTVTIARTLYRRGFTRKKVSLPSAQASILSLKFCQVTRPAIERDEDDRAAYKLLVGEHFQPEHFVFADESHFNRLTLRRQYAWAPRGNRARRRDFFIRGQR
jgi:hypothetical protein